MRVKLGISATYLLLVVVYINVYTVFSAPSDRIKYSGTYLRSEEPVARGCLYKDNRYEHAETVQTENPCLNCTCARGVLVCFLRVCPLLSSPPPGCFTARKEGQCCPSFICSSDDISGVPGSPKTTTPSYLEENDTLPPDDYLQLADEGQKQHSITPSYYTSSVTIPPDVMLDSDNYNESRNEISPEDKLTTFPSLTTLQPINLKESANDSSIIVTSTPASSFLDLEYDFDFNNLNVIRGGCFINGSLYAEGSAILSGSFCEYCYCIRAKEMCIKPKCHLTIENCRPKYSSEYSCCPTSYSCKKNRTTTTTSTTTTISTSTLLDEKPKVCEYDGKIYSMGDPVISTSSCQNCFCTEDGVKCKNVECSPIMEGCIPVIPDGHCCPVEYTCNKSNSMKSEDVSYSKDPYPKLDLQDSSSVIHNVSLHDPFLDADNVENNENARQITTQNVEQLSTTLSTLDVDIYRSTQGASLITDDFDLSPSESSPPQTIIITEAAFTKSTSKPDEIVANTNTIPHSEETTTTGPISLLLTSNLNNSYILSLASKTDLDNLGETRFVSKEEHSFANVTNKLNSSYNVSSESSVTEIVNASESSVAEVATASEDSVAEIANASDSSVAKIANASDSSVAEIANDSESSVAETDNASDSSVAKTDNASDSSVAEIATTSEYSVAEISNSSESSVAEITTISTMIGTTTSKLEVEIDALERKVLKVNAENNITTVIPQSSNKLKNQISTSTPVSIDATQSELIMESKSGDEELASFMTNGNVDSTETAVPDFIQNTTNSVTTQKTKSNTMTILVSADSEFNDDSIRKVQVAHIVPSRYDDASEASQSNIPNLTNETSTELPIIPLPTDNLNPEYKNIDGAINSDSAQSRVEDASPTRENDRLIYFPEVDDALKDFVNFRRRISESDEDSYSAQPIYKSPNSATVPSKVLPKIKIIGNGWKPVTELPDVKITTTVGDMDKHYNSPKPQKSNYLPGNYGDPHPLLYYGPPSNLNNNKPSIPGEMPSGPVSYIPGEIDYNRGLQGRISPPQHSFPPAFGSPNPSYRQPIYTRPDNNDEDTDDKSPFGFERRSGLLNEPEAQVVMGRPRTQMHDRKTMPATKENVEIITASSAFDPNSDIDFGRHHLYDHEVKQSRSDPEMRVVSLKQVLQVSPESASRPGSVVSVTLNGDDGEAYRRPQPIISKKEDTEPDVTYTGPDDVRTDIESQEPIRRADPPVKSVVLSPKEPRPFKVIPFLAEDAVGQKPNDTHSIFIGPFPPPGASQKSSTEAPVDLSGGKCLSNSRLYENGEMISKSDPCELCRCFYGKELCQKQTCPEPPSGDCIAEKQDGYCCPRYTCGTQGNQDSPDVTEPRPIPPKADVTSIKPIERSTTTEMPKPVVSISEEIFNRPVGAVQHTKAQNIPAPNTDAQPSIYTSSDDDTDEYKPQNLSPPKLVQVSTDPPKRFTTIKVIKLRTTTTTTTTTPVPPKVFTTKPTNKPAPSRAPLVVSRPPVAVSRPIITKIKLSKPTRKPLVSTSSEAPKQIQEATETPAAASTEIKSSVSQKPPESDNSVWGQLKVSGCNIFGKFYNLNDFVKDLSGPCNICICSSQGVECTPRC